MPNWHIKLKPEEPKEPAKTKRKEAKLEPRPEKQVDPEPTGDSSSGD
jgi:hypothetical protein